MAEAIGAVQAALLWGVVGWHAAALVAGLVLLALDERRLAGPERPLALRARFDTATGRSPAASLRA